MFVRALLSVLFLIVAVLARGEVIPVDVSDWVSATATVTKTGWTVSGIVPYDNGKAVNFTSPDAYARSPVYKGSITQLVAKVSSSSSELLRFLKAFPVAGSVSAPVWQMEPTITDAFTEQSFCWNSDDRVRQFRLQIEGSMTGNWRVRSLTVYTDRVEPPEDPQEDSIYSDALPVRWAPVERAVSYEVEAARVTTVLPEYHQLERWDFSILTNSTGNSLDAESVPGFERLVGVSGEYLNVQARSGGYLQAGNTNGKGKIRIALVSRGTRTAIMRLYRSESTGTDGEIEVSVVVSGGSTNRVCQPYLSTVPTDFLVEVPEDASELLVETSVKARRIRVEDVKIVTDYVPGSARTNVLLSAQTAQNETILKKLSPGDLVWRVRSFDRDGIDSRWSPYRAVALDAANPPRNRPGLLVIIR